MKTFFDASAFAKRYIEEKGSHLVDTLCQDADELSISVICLPENNKLQRPEDTIYFIKPVH